MTVKTVKLSFKLHGQPGVIQKIKHARGNVGVSVGARAGKLNAYRSTCGQSAEADRERVGRGVKG